MKKLNDIKTSELARFLDVSMPYISNVKAGRQKVSALVAQKISEHFDVPLWELRPDIYPASMFNHLDVEQA